MPEPALVLDPTLGIMVSEEFITKLPNDFPNENLDAPQVSDTNGSQRNMTTAEFNAGRAK